MISAKNAQIVDEQRDYMFGLIGLAQTDILNLIKIADRTRTDAQFEAVVKNGYSSLIDSYGSLLVGETKNFYNKLREENGGGKLNGKLPSWDDLYDRRRETSIDVNTGFVYADDKDDLSNRLVQDAVKNVNAYSFETVNFLGRQDDQFSGSRRVPRANACSFCRWKAYEFASYGTELDDIVLHKSCRCVSSPGFRFTDEGYLSTAGQELFEERLDKAADELGLVASSKADLSELLSSLRKDFRYR